MKMEIVEMLSIIPAELSWEFSAVSGSLWRWDVLSAMLAAPSAVGTTLSNDHACVRAVKCARNPW